MEKLHFIAIGGAAMHNLALALKQLGYSISGSDDEIFEPSWTRLKAAGILPEKLGWYPDKLTNKLDAVILGMHARKDNPELLKAQQLGLRIFSYPEFLYEQTKNKKRVVIAGSHGKTTITAMVVHVLSQSGINFDFMVGSQIEGYDTMVSLKADSEIAIFEGDEYLSSPLDLRPKFIHYRPYIALISGIAWDHINVFPTFSEYVKQFEILINIIQPNGALVYYNGDEQLCLLTENATHPLSKIAYNEHAFIHKGNEIQLIVDRKESVPLKIFGMHNMQNLSGAKQVCQLLGITDDQFYSAISTFPGTAKRLQLLSQTPGNFVFLDFAHSPSKVKATVLAVKEQFSDSKFIAVLELHTFSSLNRDFIPQYAHTLDAASEAYVYYSHEVVEHKKLPKIDAQYIKTCFQREDIIVLESKTEVEEILKSSEGTDQVILLMSSGNFGGISFSTMFNK